MWLDSYVDRMLARYAKVLVEPCAFLSFFLYCNTPSRGLRAGGLRFNVIAKSEKGKGKKIKNKIKTAFCCIMACGGPETEPPH